MFNLNEELFPLTIENIREHIRDEDLWKYYIGHSKTGKTFKIPWREDKNPSASLFKSKYDKNILLLQDHSNCSTYNIFSVLRQLFPTDSSLRDTLKRIQKDFNLTIKSQKKQMLAPNSLTAPIKQATSTNEWNKYQTAINITPNFIPFTTKALEYWAVFGITEDVLKFYDVRQIDYYHQSSRVYPGKFYKSITDDLTFAYTFYNPENWKELVGYKIYAPNKLTHEGKWRSSVSKNVIQGEKQIKMLLQRAYSSVAKLPNEEELEIPTGLILPGVTRLDYPNTRNVDLSVLLITKSLKDIMTWFSVLNIHSIAPQAEYPNFPIPELLYDLSLNYDTLFINYDADIVGRSNAEKLQRNHPQFLNSNCIFTSPHKDISTFVSKEGIADTQIHFNDSLQEYFSQ